MIGFCRRAPGTWHASPGRALVRVPGGLAKCLCLSQWECSCGHRFPFVVDTTFNQPGPHQVVGTSVQTRYQMDKDGPELVREPALFFFDDKEGKPVAINHHIGQRPIMAVGNSDGDFQMREWTTAGDGKRLGVLIHHTDERREWAYDRDSHIGKLERGLDEGPGRGWLIVDMKNDWKTVFPPAEKR